MASDKSCGVRGFCLAGVAWSLLAAGAAFGQGEAGEAQGRAVPMPEDLLAARRLFLEAILSESQLLTEQYARALVKAELEAGSRGDYEEAVRIQERREELAALYKGTASSLEQTEATTLAVESARLGGGVELRRDSLEGWRSSASYAEWTGVVLEPGDHYLELEVAMVAAPLIAGGNGVRSLRMEPVKKAGFEFFEVSLLPGATQNRRGFEVLETKDGVTYVAQKIGPISYPRSPVTVRLTAVDGYPLNIVRFRNLRLVPKRVTDELAAALPPEPAAATAGGTASILEKMREALQEGYRTAVAGYASDLKAWMGDDKARKALGQAELAMLKAQMEEQRKDPGAEVPMIRWLGGFGGFEDVEQAMYVPGSASSGGEFAFRSEEGEFRVRLFGVTCMPGEGGGGEDATYFAKRFGVSLEEAAPLGQVALEFASGYLEGKIVRVLVQPAPPDAPDRARLALVFLPDVGLFQNVLVDQGLAAVNPKDVVKLKGALPRAVLSSLEAREAAAKARLQPPGAWALKMEEGTP